jgi:hypothetical protein
MHPRSPYFNNTPDFLKLSEKNTNLKKYLNYDEKKKKYSIDFYNPNALKEICCALLKENFSNIFIFDKNIEITLLIKRFRNRFANRSFNSASSSTCKLLPLDRRSGS